MRNERGIHEESARIPRNECGIFRANIPHSFRIPHWCGNLNIVFVVFFVTHSARIPHSFRGIRAESARNGGANVKCSMKPAS